jgi:hypothetical protein
VSILESGRVYALARIGKYSPGSIWPTYAAHRLRVDLNVPGSHADEAMATVVLVQVATGLAIGLPWLVVPADSAAAWLWRVVLLLAVLAMVRPSLAGPLVAQLAPLLGSPVAPECMSWRRGAAAVLLQCGAWLFYGLALAALVGPFHTLGQGDLLWLISAFAVAYLVGLAGGVLFGQAAPDGLGFREIALWIGLVTVIDPGSAALVVLLTRAMTTAADLITASISSSSDDFRKWRTRVQG